MKEREFANTKDNDIFNDLSAFMEENEKSNDILYYFTLMELYNFFNNHINIENSMNIIEDSDDDEDGYEDGGY